MRAFVLSAVALFFAGAGVGPTQGEPYWFAFEFDDPNDLPQGEAWLRRYQPEPFGFVEGGMITYDSVDTQSYDFWEYSRPGALDPGPNEVFIAEWRLWVEWVSYYMDPGISLKSDGAWVVSLAFDVGVVRSLHEYVVIPIPVGDWHTYTLVSDDMRAYELYIDGELAWQGLFARRFIQSLVQWGDLTQGAASLHRWDFCRFGVVPAPLTGDVNCDGSADFADINPFVQVLTGAPADQQAYPFCWPTNADINGDGSVDFADINPFVDLLLP